MLSVGMASATVDRSPPLGKTKARDFAGTEVAESSNFSGDLGLPALPPIVTSARSGSELSSFAAGRDNSVDMSVKGDQIAEGDVPNDEFCETPKSEEHKLPEVISCPPAPRKPRPTLGTKRKVSLSARTFYIPPDLDLLFGNSNPKRQRRAEGTKTDF